MASNFNLLSEEQFLCPICLDVFIQPVSTPCGHNFCHLCLTSYWNNKPVCRCPVCDEMFDRRPNLKVNTFISELASQLVSLHLTDADIWSPGQLQANSCCAVVCDICTDTQQEAVKSCLECLTSYCNTHLEPHHRAAGLKRHTLVDPVARLEDRICKEHSHLLALFCRDDSVLLCDVCASLRHTNHDVVPVPQAHQEMTGLLRDMEANVQRMIQERKQKVTAVKESVTQSKAETKSVIAKAVQELTALVFEIQRSQMELVKVIEEKQRAAEEGARGLISSMEQELTELVRIKAQLRELRQTEDHLSFLQNFPNSSLLPHTMDLSAVRFNGPLEIRHIQKTLSSSVSQLRMLLSKMKTDINMFSASSYATLRHLQRYEVHVVLDPDTAHPLLILSDDGKEVRYSRGAGLWAARGLKPNTFTEHLAVLGQRGFSSCKFYFEVFVSGKTEWCLGVATASIPSGEAIARVPHSGLWALWFLEDKFETFCCPGETVYVGKVERVGVFVDYETGLISFYDVQTASLIYSFTECVFTEELYPYLNPCDNEFGSNLEPMVIVPVSRTEISDTPTFIVN